MNNFLNCVYWWRRLLRTRKFNHYMFFYSLNKGWYDINFENYWGKNVKPEVTYLSPENFDKFCEMMEDN